MHHMTAYWEHAPIATRSTAHLALSIQRAPLRIVGRSKGGARMACVDSGDGVHLFCLSVGKVWTRMCEGGIASPVVATDLQGVCFGDKHTTYFWYGERLVYALSVAAPTKTMVYPMRVTDEREVAHIIDVVLER